MKNDKRLVFLEKAFKALSDQTRLRIIGLLRNGEVCVCDMHGSLGLPQPTVSRHLAYLRNAGLVATRKEGLWVHYRLAELPDPVMQAVLDAVTHAIGHVDAGERDRKRLASLVELTPISNEPRPRCCC
jgi:ArsR family transcriptional regulator, arsenate/arsenite/antimonite-responsive transcriptional repressor